jgi:N-glycosylase/DNA lyase
MNTIEEQRFDLLIAAVAAAFPLDQDPCIKAALVRAVYGWSWDRVARKAGVPGLQVRSYWWRGRQLLKAAAEVGLIDRGELGETLEEAEEAWIRSAMEGGLSRTARARP